MSAGIPDSTLAEYKEVFSMFDVDGDGTIDASELDNVMKDLGTPCTAAELKELLDVVDTNKNGVIDFEEFCVMMTMRGPASQSDPSEVARSVFRALDRDGDGLIGTEDLLQTVGAVRWGNDRTPNEQDIALMLAVGGEVIDFAAFQDIITRFRDLS